MELKIDSRVLSKEGILLFSQRYANAFYISVLPDTQDYYRICLTARTEQSTGLSAEFLQNELLDCEFLASRYKETAELREAIQTKLLAVCQEEK